MKYDLTVGATVAAAQFAMFMGILFGLVPAMLLLYLMLDRYEGYFEDKRIFKALVIGIVVGSVVTMFETLMGLHDPAYLASIPASAAILFLGVGYSALESLAKVVVLNWPSSAKRKDVPYYAVPVGLGMGAAYTFIVLARGIVFAGADPTVQSLTHLQLIVAYIPVVELFIAGILIHAFSATVVGHLVMRREPFRAFAAATFLSMPFYITYYLLYGMVLPLWGTLLPTALLIYGILGVRKVTTGILDHVVPPEIAKRVRREIRKQRSDDA